MKYRFFAIVVLLSVLLTACQTAVANSGRTLPAKPAPDFTLVDQNGQTVRLADLKGKVVLLDFIYTQCGDACPALEAIMDNVRRNLGDAFPGKLNLVTITFDPEYDTSQVMKRYASGAGWDVSGWYFLTGPQADIASVNAAYGSIYQLVEEEGSDPSQSRSFMHNTMIVLIDQNGQLRQRYMGPDLGASPKILEDVRSLLK